MASKLLAITRTFHVPSSEVPDLGPIGCEPLRHCPSYLIHLARSGRDVSHTVCSPLNRHQAHVSGPHGEGGTTPTAGAARLKADPLWRACSEEAALPTAAPRSRWRGRQ